MRGVNTCIYISLILAFSRREKEFTNFFWKFPAANN